MRTGEAAMSAAQQGRVPTAATLGDFQLVREVGRGGMGVVHLARQISLGRYVAVKILPREFTADPLRRERFHREAEVISRLDHPSIVPVYAVGEEDGVHYIAMKFLDGEPLDRVIRARRPAPGGEVEEDADTLVLPRSERDAATRRPPMRADGTELLTGRRPLSAESDPGWITHSLRIAEKVAQALHHAHGRGVIHRDVKPGNILLDWNGHPWLLDFGLVRDLANEELTQPESFLGTAWYMAPETVRPGSGPADHRADIYALGVTLYEMLTLRRPFDHRSAEALFQAIVHENPVPPRRLNARLPKDLDTVILKAMAKDPEDRYQTAADLAEDLRRVRGFEPIVARPGSIFGRARRWVRRNPALSCALLFGLLSFVGMIEVSVYRDLLEQRRARVALEAADAAFEAGNYQDALNNYRVYVMLGGDAEVVAPRLREVRQELRTNRSESESGVQRR